MTRPGDAPADDFHSRSVGLVPPPPERRLAQIHGLVAAGGPPVILEPIVDLRDLRTVAVEALPQFPDGGGAEEWIADAQGLGVTLELELAVVAAALSGVAQARPALPGNVELWVAVSPGTVCAPQLGELIAGADVPMVLSIPEHAVATDHPGLLAATSELRRASVRFAVDGVAAEYAGLRHILRLHPDTVRLSRDLTHRIQRDLARAELTRAVVQVTQHLGATVVAAGIEESAEVDALLTLGIVLGQGPGLRAAVSPIPQAATVTDATTVTDGSADPQKLVRPILDLVIELTGLETAYLTVLDADHVWMEHRFVRNTGTLEVPEGLTIPWIDSLCKRCRDVGVLWTADVPSDLPPIPLGRDAPIRTFVSVPMVLADGRTAGTLCAMGSGARELDGDMLAELAFFARLLAERYPRGLGSPPATESGAMMYSQHLAVGDVRTPSPGTPLAETAS